MTYAHILWFGMRLALAIKGWQKPNLCLFILFSVYLYCACGVIPNLLDISPNRLQCRD